jgi:hypothetical protein
LTVTRSIVTNNTALLGHGDGISNSGDVAVVSDSTVSDNEASFERGGLNNCFGATLSLVRSTVSNNSARDGGGVRNLDTLTVINSTVSSNTVNGTGGGIRDTQNANMTLNSNIISGNAANSGGGVFNIGFVNIANTIVANSVSGNDCVSTVGILNSLGYNIDSDGTCGLSSSGDITGMDPLLGPLQNNGGPTMTHELMHGSPGIDAGDPALILTEDQRGLLRPKDGDADRTFVSDVGGFEQQNLPPRVPIADAWTLVLFPFAIGLFMAVYLPRRTSGISA